MSERPSGQEAPHQHGARGPVPLRATLFQPRCARTPRKPHSWRGREGAGPLWIRRAGLPENLTEAPRRPHSSPRKPHNKPESFPENLTGVPEAFTVGLPSCASASSRTSCSSSSGGRPPDIASAIRPPPPPTTAMVDDMAAADKRRAPGRLDWPCWRSSRHSTKRSAAAQRAARPLGAPRRPGRISAGRRGRPAGPRRRRRERQESATRRGGR